MLTLPAPYGPGLRLLNSLPILPAHKLRDALARGEFAKAWSTATPPAEIIGLGPYVIRSYIPGERIELVRNPRYGARGPDVQPEVERLTLRIIPSQDAERLAVEAGELDVRPRTSAPTTSRRCAAWKRLARCVSSSWVRRSTRTRSGSISAPTRVRRPRLARG